MLAALLAPALIKSIVERGFGLFEQYQNKQITLAQFTNQLQVIIVQSIVQVEQANADMVKKTFGDWVELAKTSVLVRWVWAIVTLSQCFVLFWYQFAVPFIVWKYGGAFPPASDLLLEWGYGLLVLLVGGGAVAIKRPRQPKPTPDPKS